MGGVNGMVVLLEFGIAAKVKVTGKIAIFIGELTDSPFVRLYCPLCSALRFPVSTRS